jgi:co-chaperonin GroES (HSP10)
MNNLHPINGCVLVELTESFQFVATPDKQYSTKTSGIVKAVSNEESEILLEKKVYFEEYKDGTQIEIDDKTFAFIKNEDIRGYYGEIS